MGPYRVAILGATGAVGQELLKLLAERHFPVSALRLLASPRSHGRSLVYKGKMTPVAAVSEAAFDGVQIAFLTAGSEAAMKWAPVAIEKGSLVVDNSSAWRMEQDVPLVIPEVNWHHVKGHHNYFPVGNCTAIILVMAVAPLRRFGKFRRLVVSSYQAASGSGMRGMHELQEQVRAFAANRDFVTEVFPHPIAFNLFSHNSPINEQGYNEEEWKVIRETRKMLEMPELAIEITCIRVPVLRAHSVSVNVEFDNPAPSVGAVREAIENFPGVALTDDIENNTFPMPSLAADRDDVHIGRIRQDSSNTNAISLFACADQLRKGAALNALQIAEKLVADGRV